MGNSFQYINLTNLSEICFGNEAYITDVLECFRTVATSNLDLMLTNFVVGNYDEVRRVSHMIKITGAHIGADLYLDVVARLEEAARLKDGVEMARQLGSLKRLTGKILDEIQIYLREEKSHQG